ncbi:MAG: methylmalonyl-CoA mutase family protein [Geminicoccaceae bacterium]
MNIPPSDGGLTLAGDFPAADDAQWRDLVAKVLKGADFERRLVRETDDVIAVQPLYTALSVPPGLPGVAPFVRGAAAAAAWDIRQRHGHGDPTLVNAQILEDLAQGVTSIQLCLDPASVKSLARILDGVDLELAPIGLGAGADFAAAAEQFLKLAKERGKTPQSLRADLNADPLGAAVAGAALDLEAAIQSAVRLAALAAADWPAVVTLVADGRPYHAGGASEGQELACALATGIAYLRAAVDGRMAPETAARQIGFALAVDADFFLSLAKLRALRRLWGRVLEVAGVIGAMPALRVRAETATRMFTRFDPYLNVLRGTVAAFAAAAGGATSITVLPFDHALGSPQPRSRRIARNTQLVLIEESNLGRVTDPAGGSWYVETLTEQLAAKAWALVQEIERQGGMLESLRRGHPQDLVAASLSKRRAAIASRKVMITGLSEFVDLGTPAPATDAESVPPRSDLPVRPIVAHRLGEDFEELRARSDAILARTGARPRVFLCALGRHDEFAARVGFAAHMFEAGGFETHTHEAGNTVEQLAEAFARSGARQAAICSSDANYALLAEGAACALRQGRCGRLYLMGRPDPALQAGWQAAGVDEFVYLGADVLATLQRAHEVEAGKPA